MHHILLYFYLFIYGTVIQMIDFAYVSYLSNCLVTFYMSVFTYTESL